MTTGRGGSYGIACLCVCGGRVRAGAGSGLGPVEGVGGARIGGVDGWDVNLGFLLLRSLAFRLTT